MAVVGHLLAPSYLPRIQSGGAPSRSLKFRDLKLTKIVVEVFEEHGRAAITQVTAPSEAGASAEVVIFLECDGSSQGEEAAVAPSFEAKAWQLRPAPVEEDPEGHAAVHSADIDGGR